MGLLSLVATQLMDSCAGVPEGKLQHAAGTASGPCGVEEFLCVWIRTPLCVVTGRMEGFAVPNGFAVTSSMLSCRPLAVFAFWWMSQQVPFLNVPLQHVGLAGGASLHALV